MRKIERIPVTKEGFEKLQKDLTELKRIRPEAVNTLSDARKMGDLSENGLYTAAKMRLKSIDAQIFRLNIQIKLADIINKKDNFIIGLGSKVTVFDGKIERELYLVGDYEADPKSGKISKKSPIGRSLIGKRVGDSVSVFTPSGRKVYKILKTF
jgi:transcription elongation factor GreA